MGDFVKEMRLIVTVPVDGDVSLWALRSKMREILRAAGTARFAYCKPLEPGVEKRMTAHFAHVNVKPLRPRRQAP
ncbi:MAG: hypothetical protein N2444_00220 [Methylocystis sp.]|nr:hypothetical protein [Methylocystis sp.]